MAFSKLTLKVRGTVIGIAFSIPILIIIIQNSIAISQSNRLISTYGDTLTTQMQFALSLERLMHNLQYECSLAVLYVASGDQKVERLLQAAYSKTDATLLGIEDWPRAHDEDENFRSQAALQSHITRHRTRLLLASQEAGFCADVQTKLLGYVEDMAHDPPGETRWAWKEMLAFYLLMNSKEHTSGERAVGSQFFTSGNLTQSGLTTYHREETLGKFYLSMAADYHSEFEKAEYHMLTESTLQKTIINMHKNILENKWRQPSTERALWWFGNMTEYIEILSEAAVRLGEHTLLEMKEGSHRKQLHRAVVAGAILIVFALLLWPILLTLLILIVHRIQMFYNYLKAEGKKRGTQFDASTSKS